MALNIEEPDQLVGYLEAQGLIASGEQMSATRLHGGVSNRAVLLRRADGVEWVIKQALAKLRVKADWFSSPERIHREAVALRTLARLAPRGAIPGFVWEDRENHVLIMTAVPQPHANWKELLLREGSGLQHTGDFGRLLGTIHVRASEERDWVEPLFSDIGFFESLRLEPYYGYTAERLPEAAGFLARLADEARSVRSTLVHGDFSPKNVLVHQEKLVLLDFEVAHFGDPAFDLGFALTHLLSKAHHLPSARGRFIEASHCFWGSYLSVPGRSEPVRELQQRAVRHTLGCLLARVDGRSPLEYLTAEERVRQRALGLSLLARSPGSVPLLIQAWASGLEEADVSH